MKSLKKVPLARRLLASAIALACIFTVALVTACPTDPDDPGGENPPPAGDFVAVTDITLTSATTGTVGTALPLAGTVVPENATNKTIAWSVKSGTASIAGSNRLTATAEGEVEVTATIANGATATTPFTKTFTINFTNVYVTSITGVPAIFNLGIALPLTGTVQPTNASAKTIVWSITAGNATLDGNVLKAKGPVTVTATIVKGKSADEDYVEDFVINPGPIYSGGEWAPGTSTAGPWGNGTFSLTAEDAGRKDGTAAIQIGPIPTGGNGFQINAGGNIDLSIVTALSLWVKSTGENSLIDELGFGNEPSPYFIQYDQRNTRGLRISASDTWQRLLIPIAANLENTSVTQVFRTWVTRNNLGTDAVLSIDDIEFIGDAPEVSVAGIADNYEIMWPFGKAAPITPLSSLISEMVITYTFYKDTADEISADLISSDAKNSLGFATYGLVYEVDGDVTRTGTNQENIVPNTNGQNFTVTVKMGDIINKQITGTIKIIEIDETDGLVIEDFDRGQDAENSVSMGDANAMPEDYEGDPEAWQGLGYWTEESRAVFTTIDGHQAVLFSGSANYMGFGRNGPGFGAAIDLSGHMAISFLIYNAPGSPAPVNTTYRFYLETGVGISSGSSPGGTVRTYFAPVIITEAMSEDWVKVTIPLADFGTAINLRAITGWRFTQPSNQNSSGGIYVTDLVAYKAK